MGQWCARNPATHYTVTVSGNSLGQIPTEQIKNTTDLGTFLFKVEERYLISDRGLVLTPGVQDKVAFVNTGTEIILIKPDKSEIRTTIKGITFEGNHDILIQSTFTKDDIPVGTEVWTIE